MVDTNGGDAESELRLSRRLDALERRVGDGEQGVTRTRLAAGGLGAGAVALFLSLYLPWVRGEGGQGPWYDEDGNLRLRTEDVRAEGTGWELLGAAIGEGQWLFVLSVLVLLLTSVLAFVGLFKDGRGVFVATQVAAWSVPVLLLISWPSSGEVSDPPGTGGGVWAAVFGCVFVAMTAAATFPAPSWMAEIRGSR
ncbi:hypothetical protein DFP74_2888 [Nocardiopsis sp. Huas11]|uniref:hypothetical protein n=1 Tax=Nocardiopsis sp. Huas11 TaxID=2183912 RepID=UPI000EAD61F1|nr:hypothetical protein [Nocardiopsis sp. Huas11]RKS07226.1 hypothetical protein DFP74_2888 [Nocardiopsis sp. Huas11]